MSKKNSLTVMNIIEQSRDFKRQLEACLIHCGAREVAAGGEVGVKEGEVYVTWGPLSRGHLGIIKCRAGEDWKYAIQVAISQLMCERLTQALNDEANSTSTTAQELVFSELCRLNDVNVDGSVSPERAAKRVGAAQEYGQPTVTAPFASTTTTAADTIVDSAVLNQAQYVHTIDRVCREVVLSAELLLQAIDKMHLHTETSSTLVIPLDGFALGKVFPSASPKMYSKVSAL